ncbi:hypothetical protein V3C99_013310 [Haemonchus contortus]
MREICLLLIIATIISALVITQARVLPGGDYQYRRMLQEIVGGAGSPLRGFPMAMLPDRLPAPVETYW